MVMSRRRKSLAVVYRKRKNTRRKKLTIDPVSTEMYEVRNDDRTKRGFATVELELVKFAIVFQRGVWGLWPTAATLDKLLLFDFAILLH